MIKTFRGLMVDGAQDTIALHTNDGSTGYRIVKFQIMANTPGAATYEFVVKIYKTSQTTIDGVVDFSDQKLLGVAYLEGNNNDAYIDGLQIIFDKEIFNQDIYITNTDVAVGEAVNYYIELEQVKLDLNHSTVATLKDIRNVKTQGL
jgi:hypothetical protein